MKHILRKIFFWDEPAQGAFFGLTLMLLTLWAAFSVFCACIVAYSRVFCFTAVAVTFFSWLILFCLYSLFLVLKGVANIIKRTPRFWMRLLKMLSVVVVLTPLCTVLAYNLLSDPPMTAVLALLTAFSLTFFGLAYLFRPIVNPVKLLSCFLSWIGSFLVFSTLLCLANPLEGRVANELTRPDWLGKDIPYVVPFWRWFDLLDKGCFWFTLAGFLLLASAYLLSWSILAKLSGCSMRRFYGRGIRVQWAVMAGIYVVTLCLALGSNAQYRTAVKALETHYGHPMTGVELGRTCYDGRTPDAAYWKRLDASLAQYDQEQKNTVDHCDYSFKMHHLDAVLPKELYEKMRTDFLNSLKVSGLQEQFVSPMPPGERDFSAKFIIGMSLPELSKCRQLARIEQRRCQYAIDAGDFNTAAECIAHLDILCDFLGRECFHIAYLVWNKVGLIRNEMLANLLASGLPTDKWMEEQTNQLLHWEKMYEQQEKTILYSEAVIILDAMQFMVGDHLTGRKDIDDLSDHWNYWIHFKSIRFFFPQGWWLAAKSARDYASVMKVSTFDQFPQMAIGSVLVDMLIPSLVGMGEKKRSYIASCRVLRGLIAAELHKRRTGSYPDALAGLPLDPFSEQPLKYRKGKCEVTRYYAKWLPDETEEGADDGESPPGGQWTLEEKTETIDAVQIWSAGPDGIDDGGLRSTDDIRFIIPTR